MKLIDESLAKIKKYCIIVRAICHTQTNLIGLKQKKAHVMEIQINGGTVEEKVRECVHGDNQDLEYVYVCLSCACEHV